MSKVSLFWQFYGKTVWEGVQGPNEVIYLPNGLLHTVLNLEDNVAITENFLFVDALPGIIINANSAQIFQYKIIKS